MENKQKIVSLQDLSVLDFPQVRERMSSLWEGIGLPPGHLNGKALKKKKLSEAF